MPNDTSRITIDKTAANRLREIAECEGVTPRQYLEALLHYAISCHNRPGSWEASAPFELHTYTKDDTVADKWF